MRQSTPQQFRSLSRASERILLAFFLLVGLVSAGRGLFEFWRMQQIIAQGVAGEAVVVACSPRRRSITRMRYEYIVPDAMGTPQRYLSETPHEPCQEDTRLPIRYLPTDPKQALIQETSPFETLLPYMITTAISLVMLVWLPFWQWRKRRVEAHAFAEETAPQP